MTLRYIQIYNSLLPCCDCEATGTWHVPVYIKELALYRLQIASEKRKSTVIQVVRVVACGLIKQITMFTQFERLNVPVSGPCQSISDSHLTPAKHYLFCWNMLATGIKSFNGVILASSIDTTDMPNLLHMRKVYH